MRLPTRDTFRPTTRSLGEADAAITVSIANAARIVERVGGRDGLPNECALDDIQSV